MGSNDIWSIYQDAEALTNVVRHARASEVTLSLAADAQRLAVSLKDKGRGFRPGETNGQGLANMQTRMVQIGGTFECSGGPENGTTITFSLPLNQTSTHS